MTRRKDTLRMAKAELGSYPRPYTHTHTQASNSKQVGRTRTHTCTRAHAHRLSLRLQSREILHKQDQDARTVKEKIDKFYYMIIKNCKIKHTLKKLRQLVEIEGKIL